MPEDLRADPDALLATLHKQQAAARRGRLKVFLGMCPGVGKTYAMLQEARARQAAGTEVLLGVVETHGRTETEALLAGLPLVPRLRLEYRGTVLEEMDLDAILLWHPALVVVDELAHTNAPGSRHPKRYQDVLELLETGLDVLTTVNVQHLESRRDAVQQITGVRMQETVPDTVLDQADELVLVDLSPAQLRQRLAEGKVYQGGAAALAGENFFQENHLLALREMALRLVAEHVDRDLREALQEQRTAGPWRSGDRLLVAVSASPSSEKLIRYTRRLSATMEAPWMAVYVDTGRVLPEAEQARLTQHLNLARQLGAEVMATTATAVGEALLRVARQHHVSHLVLGKPLGPAWLAWASPAHWLIRHSGDLDLHMIRSEEAAPAPWPLRGLGPTRAYGGALALVAGVTALGLLVHGWVGYWAVALLYLLALTLSALWLAQGPMLLLAALSAVLWDFLFIPPRFTLAIHQAHDVIMFALYFVVALVVGQLTTRLRAREQAERRAEQRATALYALTRALALCGTAHEAVRVVVRQLQAELQAPAAVLRPGQNGLNPSPENTLALTTKEESVANWSFQRRRPAGRFTDTLPEAEALHLPLLAGERCEGVLALQLPTAPTLERRELLETMAAQLAAFLQKEQALRVAREAQVAAKSQALQKALFDSVSHELKTPLATMWGMLEQPVPELCELRQAVRRLTRNVDHLLDATRLESGLLQPRLEWCEAGEVAQEALALAELPPDRVRLTRMESLPPARMDAGLIAQTLALLLTNAAAHSPLAEPITLHLAHDGRQMIFTVLDHGAGISPGEEEKIFGKFYRGPGAAPGGLGLGLAIGRQLAELHGGTLQAHQRPGGGALFTLRLPASESLQLPEERTA